MAKIWAENSYCVRRQVGALVVKDKMIISDGYNGTPSGFENICEDDNNVTKPYVLHAEANAITKLARSNNNSDGATIYITASPCIECAKLIIQAGIRRVVYGENLIQRPSGKSNLIWIPLQVTNRHPTSTPQAPHKYRTSCILTIPIS